MDRNYAANLAKLCVVMRRIWKQKDSKTEGWNDVAAYILENFVAKPTLPDVPEKLNGLFISDKRVVTAINDLIDCYSALKKVVEEKL